MGKHYKGVAVADSMRISMGGLRIFEHGEFTLNSEVEKQLVEHMKRAQLTESTRGRILV